MTWARQRLGVIDLAIASIRDLAAGPAPLAVMGEVVFACLVLVATGSLPAPEVTMALGLTLAVGLLLSDGRAPSPEASDGGRRGRP